MESWQKERIHKNLVELIKNTICYTTFLSRLRSEEILGQEDEERLQNLNQFEQSKTLYEIIQTRVRGFEALVKALKETKQTGALKILQDDSQICKNYGQISFDENQILGKGFGSIVYRGKFDGRDVAVKVLSTVMKSTEKVKNEIELLKMLDRHENIIRYFMMESDKMFIYLALELYVINLEDEIKMNLIKLKPTTILEKCTAGLAYLHDQNIIHGDLKPSNILLNKPEAVKISDFGLSRKIPDRAASVSISAIAGTTGWMAPEVFNMDAVNGFVSKMALSSDIFSLGCIFYYTLTNGTHLFGNPGKREFYIRHYKPQFGTGILDIKWTNLIGLMISSKVGDRPSARYVLETVKQNLHENLSEYNSKSSVNQYSPNKVDKKPPIRMKKMEAVALAAFLFGCFIILIKLSHNGSFVEKTALELFCCSNFAFDKNRIAPNGQCLSKPVIISHNVSYNEAASRKSQNEIIRNISKVVGIIDSFQNFTDSSPNVTKETDKEGNADTIMKSGLHVIEGKITQSVVQQLGLSNNTEKSFGWPDTTNKKLKNDKADDNNYHAKTPVKNTENEVTNDTSGSLLSLKTASKTKAKTLSWKHLREALNSQIGR